MDEIVVFLYNYLISRINNEENSFKILMDGFLSNFKCEVIFQMKTE